MSKELKKKLSIFLLIKNFGMTWDDLIWDDFCFHLLQNFVFLNFMLSPSTFALYFAFLTLEF